MSAFTSLGVPARLSELLAARGITTPTPIQAATLPDSLAGHDVLGRGRTGSGKTYAFLLPLVARLAEQPKRRQPNRPRALVLAPTRELANQINEALEPLAAAVGLNSRTVFGGVNQKPQVAALTRGVDLLVACPGRLEDLIGQGHASLGSIEIVVIDEADHMADLGFLPAVRRLLDQTPTSGQRMLFSATLDKAVDSLVKRFLKNPVVHEADSPTEPVAEMAHHVLHVTSAQHLPVLTDLVAAPGRSVVFARTKHRARKIARQLNQAGVPAGELQGNMSQAARERSMAAFHSGEVQTLVATDIAARGIHVDEVALVIHADPPAEHKAYTHRSGRTARAGAAGTVVTLMLDEQRRDVADLTRKAGVSPKVTKVDAHHPLLAELAPGERSFPGGVVKPEPQPNSNPRRGASGRRGGGSGTGPRRGGAQPQRSGAQPQRDGASTPRKAQPARSEASAARSRTQLRGVTTNSGGAAAFSAATGRRRHR